jgi:hypothetical protein
MTVNYKQDAMIEVRKFLWDKLTAAGLFNPDHYYSENISETIIPILPVQQAPEMNQFLNGKKHFVYDKIGMSYENMWAICCEQILFTIYAPQVSDIIEIRNFMTDEFRRMDESAKDINASSVTSNKFNFYSVFIADISPISPSEELQGMFATDVILEIKYGRATDRKGRFV